MKNTKKRKMTTVTKRNHAALRSALYDLMKTKEFSAVTVMEICEKANVPRATFYNYFEDKNGLLKYCFSVLTESIAAQLIDCEAGSKQYFEKLVNIVVDYIYDNKRLISKLLNADEGMGLTEIQAMLSVRFEENFLKKDVDYKLPIKLMSEFYAGSIIFMLKWWLENDGVYKKHEIADYIALLVNPERFM